VNLEKKRISVHFIWGNEDGEREGKKREYFMEIDWETKNRKNLGAS